MLVDTQPATHQHLPASGEVREAWVTARLIGVVMDGAKVTWLAGICAIPLMVYLMFGVLSHAVLTGWVAAMVAMYGYRFYVIDQYRRYHHQGEGSARKRFIARHGWSWIVIAILWGGSLGISFQQINTLTQFVTGLVVLGHGIVALTVFSPYLPLFRRHVGGLILSAVAGLLLPGLLGVVAHPNNELMGLLSLLMLAFGWLLYAAGRRMNTVYRSSFELQFSNQELIDSLTQQTRAALRAVATKNRFLASAAHDLRQPVHALSLYADWLGSEPEMAQDIAPRILQSTRAINELFDSLFDLTRIDAGNYKVRLQPVDVAQLLSELVTQFASAAKAKSLVLRTRVKPCTVLSDPVVLRRILGNLVSNAMRHTSAGGVLMALRQRRDSIVLEVWDTGVGIAPEHQQAIFQEFYRVSQHQGTEDTLGLGLTVVSKLSTLMGYQLSLHSVFGKGSVFRVTLPAAIQATEASVPATG